MKFQTRKRLMRLFAFVIVGGLTLFVVAMIGSPSYDDETGTLVKEGFLSQQTAEAIGFYGFWGAMVSILGFVTVYIPGAFRSYR